GGRLGTVIRHGYCLVMREAGMGLAYQFAAKAAALCWECRARFDERRGSRFGERLLAEGQYCSSPGGLQVLLEHLGVALVVVQLGTLLGQALHRAGLEAAFAEPVRGTCGKHEQPGQRAAS